MKPVISIIVPVYNVEQFLSKCVQSILKQKFTDFELILVNDGSTDNSGEICDQFARKDNRVKVFHKEYGGVSTARNLAVKEALGDYIGFVDSDDRIDENMYEELISLIEKTGSEIAICKLGREINGKVINKEDKDFVVELDHVDALKELFMGNLYRHSLCNKLFKASCFEKVYFPEGRIHEDLSTTYRLFANAKKSVYTNYMGYIYIKRKNSILTSTFNKNRLDAFTGWDEILAFMSKKYRSLSHEVFSSFGYWAVDNVFHILNQVENESDRNQFLIRIQEGVSHYYKEMLKNRALSIKYKYIITLLHFHIGLLLLLNNIQKLVAKS